jgi:diacylglycerol kinase family enzyme
LKPHGGHHAILLVKKENHSVASMVLVMKEAKPPSGNWVVLVMKKKKPFGGCQLVSLFLFFNFRPSFGCKKKATRWFQIWF